MSIYLLRGDDDLVRMTEAPYKSEDILQALLAKYPDLLAGDLLPGDERRRWLLVGREASLQLGEGATRGAVDHLFLDQEAVPTLVEVKRSSDARIRREVIGQMLDYAASAALEWPSDRLRDIFERRCQAAQLDAGGELAGHLGPGADMAAFWEQAASNLRSGRIRLVFVADAIPVELRRVVEFLNAQMDRADVLALEVKQYVGEGLRTLVPRVIGQTAEAVGKRRRGERRDWDEASFLTDLKQKRGPAELQVARELLEWARVRMPRFTWGHGKQDGSFVPVLDAAGYAQYPLALYSSGRAEIQFQWLTNPPFDAMEMRRAFMRRLNEIPGVAVGEASLTKRPSIQLALLAADPEALEALKRSLDWFCDTILAYRP